MSHNNDPYYNIPDDLVPDWMPALREMVSLFAPEHRAAVLDAYSRLKLAGVSFVLIAPTRDRLVTMLNAGCPSCALEEVVEAATDQLRQMQRDGSYCGGALN